MEIQQQPTFLKALQQVMANGIAAVTLTTEEIFSLASNYCPTNVRIRYGAYLRFLHSFNEYGEPTETNELTEQLLEIHDFLQAKEAQQKMAMLEAIKAGQKDWRRFVWLLQFRQKEERLKLAQAKQRERDRKEQQKAKEADNKQNVIPASLLGNATNDTSLQVPVPDKNVMQYRKAG